MKEFFFFFFVLNYIKSDLYDYEPIEEIIPKSSILFIPKKSYKIYEYYPLCPAEEGNLNQNKSVYLMLYGSYQSFDRIYIYTYDNYSNIEQDESGNFKNYIWSDAFNNYGFYLRSFTCNYTYYFVIFYGYGTNFPLKYQFIIFEDKPDNIIQINPSLSDYFVFMKDTIHPLKLKYMYEENKIVLITLRYEMNLKIFENATLIYDEEAKDKDEIVKLVFKKDFEYNIIFEYTRSYFVTKKQIIFQFFEEKKYMQHNFNQSSLILLNKYEYYIEVDLSKYSLGEDIFLYVFSNGNRYIMNYQYKKNEKNLVKLVNSLHYHNNFIRIKKNDNDNLILYIKINSDSDQYKSIDILNFKVEEVTSNITLEIKEPKVFYIDYYDFSEYNSFGIYSNQTFLFLEQIFEERNLAPNWDVQQIKIVKRELYYFNRRKNALIFFIYNNYSNESAIVEFRKFDYQIITNPGEHNFYALDHYLQFSKDNDSPKEYYFYINHQYLDVFLPVFGSYESYFIPEERIRKLSDLDFTDQTINNDYSYQKPGYLKIKSNDKYSMFHHFIMNQNKYYPESIKLETGKIYYYLISNLLVRNISLALKYDYDRNISIKFKVYKLNSNESLILIFNGENYTLNETPIEIHFEYKKYNPELIYFSGVNISNKTFIEIKIGF